MPKLGILAHKELNTVYANVICLLIEVMNKDI